MGSTLTSRKPGQLLAEAAFGVSPEPPNGDEQKLKIGFKGSAEGVSGEFEIAKKYQANFDYTLIAPSKVRGGDPFQATLRIKNTGNLLDVAKVQLYGDAL